jgi:hypothetical protein
VRRDVAGGHAARGQRQHDLIDAIQTPMPLAHDRRLERAIPITRHLDLDRADLGQHRLGPGAVAGVAAVAAHRVVLVVAQMLTHLGLQRRLEHRLGQPSQQATTAHQLHTIGASLLDEFLRELLLINLSRHRLDRLGHCWSFPQSTARRVGPVTPLFGQSRT